MPATFTVDAYPTERFSGTVRQIRNAPQTVQNVVTYDAVIDVDNTELKLKPGMTANVTFVYAEKERRAQRAERGAALQAAAGAAAPGAAGGAARGAARGGAPPSGGTAGGTVGARASATRRRRPSDQRQVWVLRGERPTQVNIKIGVTDGSRHRDRRGRRSKRATQVITDVADGDAQAGRGASQPAGPRFRGF